MCDHRPLYDQDEVVAQLVFRNSVAYFGIVDGLSGGHLLHRQSDKPKAQIQPNTTGMPWFGAIVAECGK